MTTQSSVVEKARFVDQNISARFKRIQAFILDNHRLFSTTGVVVAGWRYYRNNRLGPFFRLAYRQNNRQSSLYLGRSRELAEKVRCLLADLQFHRTCRRLRVKLRASLRLQKTRLQENLHAHGYRMKGFEIHKSKLPCAGSR